MSLTARLWIFWLILTVSGSSVLLASVFYGGPVRKHFLIGKTTVGHHQIELGCESCHTDSFSDINSIQTGCLNCHEEELKVANDSHPIKKFRDPRNADRLEKLNATLCVTCHREHNEEITSVMGVTLPGDFCFKCHENIAKDRPETHQNLDFAGCTSAGCHNFHDNRALYEDFLEKHQDQPAMKLKQFVANHDWTPPPPEAGGPPRGQQLALTAADAPETVKATPAVLKEWHETAHAEAGVNCSGCHTDKPGKEGGNWVQKPTHTVCATCHQNQARTFLEGKHGMRLRDDLFVSKDGLFGLFKKEGFSPMRPELARAPMSPKAHGRELGCVSCHNDHSFDTAKAQVTACTSCHTDDHTKTYEGSPHHKLWVAEQKGELPKGSGVTCSTCHMPRLSVSDDYGTETVFTTHNQNDNLRPNEKMIRPVCASCHGLQFTLDALADPKLISSNFNGQPSTRVESIDWVLKRHAAREAKARAEKKAQATQ